MIKDGSIYCDACGFLCLGARTVKTRERIRQIALHGEHYEICENPTVCNREACLVAIENDPTWMLVRRPRVPAGLLP